MDECVDLSVRCPRPRKAADQLGSDDLRLISRVGQRCRAQHGFIEEETGRGTKRERWWRVVEDTKVLETAEFHDDPDTRGALSVYMHELVQQYFSRVTNHLSESWDGDWQRAGTISDWRDLRMTPAQLKSLNDELMAVIPRHTLEPGAEAAPGALPIIVQIQSFPRKERGSG